MNPYPSYFSRRDKKSGDTLVGLSEDDSDEVESYSELSERYSGDRYCDNYSEQDDYFDDRDLEDMYFDESESSETNGSSQKRSLSKKRYYERYFDFKSQEVNDFFLNFIFRVIRRII